MGMFGRRECKAEGKWLYIPSVHSINIDKAQNMDMWFGGSVKSVYLLSRVDTKKLPVGSHSGDEEAVWMGGSSQDAQWCQMV